MRRYYLFVMKNEIYKVYHKNTNILYKTLYNLYQLEAYDFSYGISLYRQLCQPFSVKVLENYIQSKYKCVRVKRHIFQVQSLVEKTFVKLGYATTIILTNVTYPELFKVFNIYNRKIFVCDFENQEYFWLAKGLQKIGKNPR